MVSTKKDPVLAILSLSGGNDGLNTVIPRTNGLYRDYRPNLAIPEDQIIPINDELGFHPAMAPLKKFWDEGKLAIFLGIGYPNASYSHFRSMDIWHTCEPDTQGSEGWLGRVIKDLDPNSENVLTGVNFGRGLPRALAKDGVTSLDEFARCADWELAGGYTSIDGKRVKDDGLLESFDISLEEAQYLVMKARIEAGIVDPADLEVAAGEDGEEGAEEGAEGDAGEAGAKDGAGGATLEETGLA